MRTIWVKIETPDYDDEEPRLLEQDIKQELCACWHYWGKENIAVYVDADYIEPKKKKHSDFYPCADEDGMVDYRSSEREAEWIEIKGGVKYRCSECNGDVFYKTRYCPRCGAKMG